MDTNTIRQSQERLDVTVFPDFFLTERAHFLIFYSSLTQKRISSNSTVNKLEFLESS